MTHSTPDTELIVALRAGHSTAYEQLYKDHFNMVKYLVLNNSGTEANASDVFQDALIVLFEKVNSDGFSLTATIKTYLYSICRNIWLKRLREVRRKASITDFEEFITDDAQAEEEDSSERQQKIITQCLSQLGDPCKTLLTQFYYFKKNMEELAASMGYTNAENAKNQKYKCLKRLRKMALEMAK